MSDPIEVIELDAQALDDAVNDFAEVLRACVHDGASVGFILPFDMVAAREFWITNVRPAVEAGNRILMAVKQGGDVVGTVQLDMETFPNQMHRAGVSKLLVHPKVRRLGIASKLMQALESNALENQRHLLTLDTITGEAAQSLYLQMGYQIAGEIPDFARAALSDRLEPTCYMYKLLGSFSETVRP